MLKLSAYLVFYFLCLLDVHTLTRFFCLPLSTYCFLQNNINYFLLKIILQLAESGTFLGQVDLFKVRGKFALSDAYEDHFLLPKGKIITVTHRRVVLLQVCCH